MDRPSGVTYKHAYFNYNEKNSMREIVALLPDALPSLRRIVLYGSKARGDFLEDSDIDLLLVTDDGVPTGEKFRIYDLIYEIQVEHDVVMSVVFASEKELAAGRAPLLKMIRTEGVALWSRE